MNNSKKSFFSERRKTSIEDKDFPFGIKQRLLDKYKPLKELKILRECSVKSTKKRAA
tara:strand:- start:841 stop:1011 length:171 start_codon:yes stop_codon:yes gene_type:complete